MKTLSIKNASVSAIMVWILGVAAYLGSYYVPVLDNPEVQANLVLSFTLIPASILGAYVYYRKGFRTNGLLLGSFMFLVSVLLDAVITVPVFIAPYGGDHLSFFGDPVFWLIGLEYITVVSMYWVIRRPFLTTQGN